MRARRAAPVVVLRAGLTHKPSARDLADAELLETIGDIYRRSSQHLRRAPRVLGQLRRRGHRVGRHACRPPDACRTAWSERTRRKKWRRGRPDAGGAPDLLNRDFRAAARTSGGSPTSPSSRPAKASSTSPAIRDLCHRGIVGWDTDGRQDAALVVSALTMALGSHRHPADVIHHADKGIAIHVAGLRFAAGNADMHLSFGSTGDAFDNAAMETFWARLKVEIAWIRGSIWFETRADAHAYLFEFIEVFYNRQRHQTGLGHLTPAEYADKWRRDHGGPNLA